MIGRLLENPAQDGAILAKEQAVTGTAAYESGTGIGRVEIELSLVRFEDDRQAGNQSAGASHRIVMGERRNGSIIGKLDSDRRCTLRDDRPRTETPPEDSASCSQQHQPNREDATSPY
jgi:hypothetical protein